jgi:hypothetical protein
MSWPEFSSSTAGLLLPWVALFAQLGLQTGTRRGDIRSIFVSIGSPAWISSSVALTILFRNAVRRKLQPLFTNCIACPSATLYFTQKCKAAQTILQSFLQAPIRINTRPGFLAALIVFPRINGGGLLQRTKLQPGNVGLTLPSLLKAL